jgi:flagellar biosynthesis activator protein FlaF
MQNAARAYGRVAKEIASPRELESDLLLKAAAQLQAVQDAWDDKRADLDAALLYNRKLWMVFVSSVTTPDHPMPLPIRQNVASLAVFVMKQTLATMIEQRPEQLTSLININRELAAGLRGSGG